MLGQIHKKHLSDTQDQNIREMERTSESLDRGTESPTLIPEGPTAIQRYNKENMPPQNEGESKTPSAIAHVAVPESSKDTANLQKDFSSCQRLSWPEHEKDWQKYVNIKEVKSDDIVESCCMWKPTQPMNITSDRDSLRYLFESERDMQETFRSVTTKEPGCAVVCRTWRFHISGSNAIEELPGGHICDITLTSTGRVSFWVIVDVLSEGNFESHMEYLLTTGRIQKGAEDMSNLSITCRLLPLATSENTKTKVNLRLHECPEIQRHLDHMHHAGTDIAFLQRSLIKVILSKEAPLKRCIGDHTSITLSSQQAEVLMDRAKVNYITGPAGSGKSYTAASLCKMYGKDRSVYICTTKAFLEYLKFNGYTGRLVLGDQDLLMEIKSGIFENKICVVMDDGHKFTCTRKSMKDLFKILAANRDLSLFVFADNNYQSFDRERQQAVLECILELTRTVLKHTPLHYPLTDIYRNTRKVVSFMQAAIQDVYDGHQKIQSAKPEDGEGVECIRMANLWHSHSKNDLVVYLRSLL